MSVSVPLTFHVDQPSHWRLSSGSFEIIGWAYAGPEHECRDIRAKIDGRIFYGLFGLDRTDIENQFGKTLGARRSGFVQRAQAWFGAQTLTLEWAAEDGVWREFFRVTLDTQDIPGGRLPLPMFRGALVYQTLDHFYRHFHLAPWPALCAEADRMLAEVVAPATDVTDGPQFAGCIENPGFWVDTDYDKFRLTGWTYGKQRRIEQLSATTALLTENRLIDRKERPDVASRFPDAADAGQSGFYGLVDVQATAPSPVNLKVFATLADGRREIVFARRVHIDRRNQHEGPVPIFRSSLFWKCTAALFRGCFTSRFSIDSLRFAWAEVRRLRKDLAERLASSAATMAAPPPTAVLRNADPYTRWVHTNRLGPRLVAQLARESAPLGNDGPLISVVVPAYNTPETYLTELLASLREQIYPRWELCIANDASPQPQVRTLLDQAARQDARIKVVHRAENGHISRATNSALEIATGEFVALLDHDDLLPRDALLHVARAIAAHPDAGYFYTDEDKLNSAGVRYDPQLKGGWSPEMAITHNYTHHLTVIRRRLVAEVGGMRPDFNGAQDIDLFLRCFEKLNAHQVIHIPFVCYHWRAHAESTATRGDQKSYLFDAARRAIAETIQRRGLAAEPFLPEFAQRYALCLHQLRWQPVILRDSPVTLVIPSKNHVELLRACLDSLARTTPRESTQVIVVDDASDDPEARAYLASLPARTDLRCRVLHAPASPEGFNYSRLINLGSAQADTPLLLHLNNDVTALKPGWLEDMAGWLSLPEVGVVGARLLFPDGRINHAGISLGREDGLPATLFEGQSPEQFEYLFLARAARNVAAVTGACLMTRTALFRELGGFDERDFGVAYNDVDFCLRARARGSRIVYTPQAELQHIGSASRGSSYASAEHVAFLARHGSVRDPYLSESLRFPPASLAIDPHHHLYADEPQPFRAVVITHNLNLEGAPLIACELSRFLARQPGVQVTVLSPLDGPLRRVYAEAGLKVVVVDPRELMNAANETAFNTALANFSRQHSWAEFDLVIANTLMSFWAIHLAARLNKPSVFYVHESAPAQKFFAPYVAPALLEVTARTLALATRVVFAAEATRGIFENENHHDHFRTVPSWIDVAAIQEFASRHDRRALRLKHGLDPDATIIVNIGSVCERKGQHIFVRAIDLLRKDTGAARPAESHRQFLMVGGRDSFYQETLIQDMELIGLQDVRIVPQTSEVFDFHHLADLLVCTSFEESFPRVLLEAMAFRTPIVSTDVDGIPEMLINRVDAYLVPAGDAQKLSVAIGTALRDLSTGDTRMAARAHARVNRSFHLDRLLPRHLQLCREALCSG